MAFFKKPRYVTVTAKKKDIPKNLYTRCPVSGDIIYNRELKENLMVVPSSGYHFPLSAADRIKSLVDEGSFVEHDANLRSVDKLNFTGLAKYKDKLIENRKKTGLEDAVISGMGTMDGTPVSLAAMEFQFLGASMGSVVGEKITRSIERAVAEKSPLIIIAASGGARMHEGVLSLMQMAKTSAALARLSEAGLPFVSVMTNPTFGGVTASFATLGDVILAEPGALIGFAGPRVIKEGTGVELPKGFQTAEFLLAHGLVDQIVPRAELRDRIITLLQALFIGRKPVEQKNGS